MTYTCNKKSFPLFSKDCKNCPEYNPCAKGGKWCFVAAIENERIVPDACMPSTNPIMEPIAVKHDYRNIKVAENTTITIDLEKLKENMKKSYYPNLMQLGG